MADGGVACGEIIPTFIPTDDTLSPRRHESAVGQIVCWFTPLPFARLLVCLKIWQDQIRFENDLNMKLAAVKQLDEAMAVMLADLNSASIHSGKSGEEARSCSPTMTGDRLMSTAASALRRIFRCGRWAWRDWCSGWK